MSDYPLVSIISVNFNGLAYTLQMIESVKQVSWPNVEIIVVDNASKQDPAEIESRFPEVKLIRSSENLGFAGANNLGVAAAKGEYFIFLNNDTEVHPGFIGPLVAEFQKDPKLGMASPKIIFDEEGRRRIIQFAGTPGINKFTMREGHSGHGEEDNGQHDVVRDTELVHGAAMMVSREVAEKVGLMPDIFFLYYEEHDWCEMTKRHGYKAKYVGTSKIYHKESLTVGKNSVIKSFYMVRGRLLYMRRNTKGLEFLSSLLFFMIAAFPKNTLVLLMQREFRLLKAYWQGVFWHLGRRHVKENPQLVTDASGNAAVTNVSGERIRKF
ncbi:MAG: glycosyltransferase family 2 protein [Balneolales bacterium]|nr:glycosyltransferase family 2 protein [Balneolales bacterium]